MIWTSTDTNRIDVIMWSVIWTVPMIAIHLLLVGLNTASSLKGSSYFWTTFDRDTRQCLVPIISTMAFTCFYAIFLVFYIFYSKKFAETLINRRLQQRVRFSQIFFALFFPFEVLLRFILAFLTKYQTATEVLGHIFFFMDLAICLVGLLEFALFPVLDATEYPLMDDAAVTLLGNITPRGRTGPDGGGAIVLNAGTIKSVSSSTSSGKSSTSLLTDRNSIQPLNLNVNGASIEDFKKQMADFSGV